MKSLFSSVLSIILEYLLAMALCVVAVIVTLYYLPASSDTQELILALYMLSAAGLTTFALFRIISHINNYFNQRK